MEDQRYQSDSSIPYGLDPVTFEQFMVEEADPGKRYVCPKCRRLLDRRDGPVYRPYFAHSRDPSGVNDCPWYRGADKSIEENRKESVEVAQRIRVFIGPGLTQGSLQLFGSIPPLSLSDIPLLDNANNTDSVSVVSQGLSRPIDIRRDLLPDSNLDGLLLDPNAESYSVEIPRAFSNGGAWIAPGLSEGDIFIGVSDYAERIVFPEFVSSGQFVYKILNKSEQVLGDESATFKLGNYRVLRVQIKDSNNNLIRKWIPNLNVDVLPLHADVIFPLEEDPNKIWLDRIAFQPNAKLTLALTPPYNSNPLLEVLTIPFQNEVLHLGKLGEGTPRFILVEPSENNPFRLLVHWPLVPQRDILTDFVPGNLSKCESQIAYKEIEIYLTVNSGEDCIKLDPLEYPIFEFKGKLSIDGFPVIPELHLYVPLHFNVSLSAEFPGKDGFPVIRLEGQANSENIYSKVLDIFSRAARKVMVEFGNLGVVSLHTSYFYNVELNRMDEEKRSKEREEETALQELQKARIRAKRNMMSNKVEECIKDISLPYRKHISLSYVRGLLGLPANSSMDELRIYKNMIRRNRKKRRQEITRKVRFERNGKGKL